MTNINDVNRKTKAVGLISGGLDSILALRVLLDLGIEVVALNLKTPFCTCDSGGRCFSLTVTEEWGVPLRRVYGGEDYIQMIKQPRHGYGKNMNPCLDCRIYLFTKAREIMENEGADFVFTGEVLGERPMSQRKEAMDLIERESGLKGKVLRPLSAKLLEPTLPEKEGRILREKLFDIQGRSRKPQLEMARRLGINEFPNPAGGCLLTDANFARKIKDSFIYKEDTLRHIQLLKIGRHFRLPTGAKVIAGRDQRENEILMDISLPSELKFTAHDCKSSYALLLGEGSPENQTWAAGVCARYSDRENLSKLAVRIWSDPIETFTLLEAEPLEESVLSQLRIGG
jgi:tRNA-specific 2-thiouridylase